MLVLSDAHGKKSSLEEILSRVDKKSIEAILVAGDLTTHGTKEETLEMIELLSFTRLFCVPGNMDSIDALKAMNESGCSLHCKRQEFDGKKFAGMGGGLKGQAGSIVFSEQEIREKLFPIAQNIDVLVTHLPPKTSSLDLAGASHIGSKSVRECIEKNKPVLAVSGHAHESRGIEWINETLCVNPGPAKLGCAAMVKLGRKAQAELL